MKTFFLIPFLVFSTFIYAQENQLDTILANDSKNVAIFFPNPIKQAITGSDNFVFTYNREKEQYFGLLQAQPGVESNLLVLTSNGKVYSYILKYNKELKILNRFIKEQESIGTEKPIAKNISKIELIEENYENRITFFEKFSHFLLNRNFKSLASKNENGIILRLKAMVYQHSEVYLVMEIENKSGIDFEVNYLNVSISSSNKKRKSSYQDLNQKPVYKYSFPSIVKNSESKRFVYVLQKFVLGNNEKLHLELNELNGSRKISTKLVLRNY